MRPEGFNVTWRSCSRTVSCERSVSTSGGKRTLSLQTQNLSRADVYVDGRPTLSVDVKDGATASALPQLPATASGISLEVFDGGELALKQRLSPKQVIARQ